jgi:uncharacterized iron-regulated membrane protein
MNRRIRFKPRAFFQRLHLWATLTIGAFLLIVTTTGSLALFRHEINRLTLPALYQVTPSSQPVDMDEARAVVQRAFPKEHLETVIRASNAEPYLFYVGENPSRTVTVDPGTGKLNGSFIPEHTFVGFMAKVHYTLLSDKMEFKYPAWVPDWSRKLIGENLGEFALKIVAFALLIMVLTGAVLWYPGVKKLALAFKLRLERSEYIRQYDWHKLIGFASLPFLAMWALTALNFYEPWNGWIKTAWYTITRSSDAITPPEVKSKPGDTPQITASRAGEIARATVPDARLISVSLPHDKDGVVDIWMARGVDPYAYGEWPGNVNLKLDQRSGTVLDNSVKHTSSWGADVYNNWTYPLHAGIAVPWWGRLIWLGFGLFPLVLAYTGLRMWWLKRRARLQKRASGQQEHLEPATSSSD